MLDNVALQQIDVLLQYRVKCTVDATLKGAEERFGRLAVRILVIHFIDWLFDMGNMVPMPPLYVASEKPQMYSQASQLLRETGVCCGFLRIDDDGIRLHADID